MVAYSYIRFSHPKQRLGDSQRRQLDATRDYCRRHGLALDENFRLTDLGTSAYRSKNSKIGALGVFLDLAEGGKIATGAVLIVESLDRISRDEIDEALELFLRIIRSGVDLVTLVPERRHSRKTIKDIIGLIEPILIMSRANESSSMLSARIAELWAERRKGARAGDAPIGKLHPWWLDNSGDAIAVVPERAAVVKQIFAWRLGGHGLAGIVKKLNADPKTVRPRFADKWTHTAIYAILKNRAVIGEYQPNRIIDGRRVPDGEPVAGYFPAVIPEEQFYEVQKGWHGKPGRHPKTMINIFTGKILNGHDGESVHCYGSTQTYKGKKLVYHNLISSGAKENVPGADRARIKYETFERAFLSFVKELKPSDFSKDRTGVQDGIAATAGELAKVEHLVRVIKERIGGKDPDEVSHYFDLLDQHEARRRELAASLADLKSKMSNQDVDAVGELGTLAAMLDGADEDAAWDLRLQIKSRVDQLIESIEIYPSVRPERGVHFRVQFDLLVIVHFRDGGDRYYVTDHDANMRSNVKLPEEKAMFGEFLKSLPLGP